MGSTSFWHKKNRFRLYRKKESLMNSSGWQAMKDQEEIKISRRQPYTALASRNNVVIPVCGSKLPVVLSGL
jgi:hypothetical protein